MRYQGLIAIIGLCALAACGPRGGAEPDPAPEEPAELVAPEGFEHDQTFDVAGYYQPTSEISVGELKLAQFVMGADSDFALWEEGERDALFGPILIGFDDETPSGPDSDIDDLTLTIRPDSYRVFPGEVSFRAYDEAVGEIVFVGRYNQIALADAKAASESDGAVLTGDLQIADQRFDNVGFSYWIGD